MTSEDMQDLESLNEASLPEETEKEAGVLIAAEELDSLILPAGQPSESPRRMGLKLFLYAVKTALVLACVGMCAILLLSIAVSFGGGSTTTVTGPSSVAIMDKFDMIMTNKVSEALDGVMKIEKTYWLSDADQVAPKPNPANYGTAASAAELGWLLEEAAELINGQDMLFNTQIEIWDQSQIHYYYDETILVITWKEYIEKSVYTFSEVKIAHPSQLRRFLADGMFGSDKQYVTTDMAASVNAVVASSGDFYKHRRNGIVVYEGVVQRFEASSVDNCFINDQGELLLTYRNQIQSIEEAQRFVDENKIRFSLAFGPILVDNGVECAPRGYSLGEINDKYSRMALCQRDELHYLLVNSTRENKSQSRHTIKQFARIIAEKGCQKAYALDGGQTTVIAMDAQAINKVDFGYQRAISDIIYFATALPDGE